MRYFVVSLVVLTTLLISSCANQEHVEVLIRNLEHRDESVRKEAIRSLCNIGPDALAHIGTGLEHRNWHVREGSLWTIHLICHGNIAGIRSAVIAELTPAVRRALKDEKADVRMTAAIALGDLTFIRGSFFRKKYEGGRRDAGAEVIADLDGALKDADWRVRFNVVEALVGLRYVEPESVAYALVKALGDQRDEIRMRAIEGLADVGHLVPDALPQLKRVAASDDSWVGGITRNVIEKIERKISQQDLLDRPEAVQ